MNDKKMTKQETIEALDYLINFFENTLEIFNKLGAKCEKALNDRNKQDNTMAKKLSKQKRISMCHEIIRLLDGVNDTLDELFIKHKKALEDSKK